MNLLDQITAVSSKDQPLCAVSLWGNSAFFALRSFGASALRKASDKGLWLKIEKQAYNKIPSTQYVDLFYRRGAKYAE